MSLSGSLLKYLKFHLYNTKIIIKNLDNVYILKLSNDNHSSITRRGTSFYYHQVNYEKISSNENITDNAINSMKVSLLKSSTSFIYGDLGVIVSISASKLFILILK